MSAFRRTLLTLALVLVAAIHVWGQGTLSVTISADNNGVICSGNSINLKAVVSGGTAPYSYFWTTGETTATINVNKAATYTVTVSDNAGGQAQAQIVVTAAASPAVPTASAVIVCKGSPATLQATAPAGAIFQWYDSNNTFLAQGDTYTTAPISASTFYYVDATVGGCTGPRTIVTVTVRADPNTTGATICAGNTATISATGGDSFFWYDAPNGNQVGQGASFVTPILTTSTTYYVVAVTNGCSSSPVAATVNVTPYPKTPVPTATSLTLCSGSSANLHADVSDGGTVAWYDSPTSTTPLISSPDYSTPALTGTTTYYAENSLGQCTSPRVAVTVNVTPIPDAPTVTPAPAATCYGTSAVLTASATSGGSFAWYADAAGTSPLPNNTANPFITPVLTANTTYYVRTVSSGGCVSALTPVTITINDLPPNPTVGPVAQVCPGTTATLTAIAPGGTYSWYNAATGGTLLFTGDTYNPVITANTTYYVQVTNANGCVSGRTAVPVTMLPATTPPTAPSVTICYNTAATLTASGSDNYQWYDAATGGTLLTSGDTFVTGALTSNTTYYVETTVNGCTSTRTAVNVTVTPVPQQPTVSGGASTVCPGTVVPLSASVTDGGTIKWYSAATGGTALATGNNYSPTVNTTTTYYAENTLGTCTSAARTGVTVTTTPVSFPLFQYSSATICNTAGTVTPTVNPPGGTFSASPATLIINSTTGAINAALSPLGKYTVTFKSNNSCQTISQVTISIVLSPDATFAYSGAPYCQYATSNPSPTFTGTASAGKFTATPAGLVIDPNTGVINLQTSTPGTYDITNTIAANGTCPQATYTQTGIVIDPGVTINAGANQTIKSGTTAQLAGSVTGPSGVKWTGGTGTFSNPNITNPVYTPGAGETTATLTLSTTSGTTCGVTTDQVVITISPQPAAPTVTGASTCAGSSVTLKATAPGGTYEWYDQPTGGSKLFTGPNFTTPALSANTTYYVQTTVSGNTSNRTPVTVTINAIPPAPASPAVSTCFNTSAKLTATGSPGTYEWYATAFGGTPLSTTNTYTTPVLTGNTSFYVQAVNNSCIGPRTKVDVTIIQPPAFTSAATGQVCSGSPSTYNITTDITATYSWDRAAVAGISNPAAIGTSANITETLLNTTASAVKVTYNITATSAQGCISVFKYVLTVNPFGHVTSASKGNVCDGSPVNYAFTFSDPGITFRWTRAAVPGISNLPVSDQAAPVIKESLYNTTNAPIDVTYTFNYLEGNCGGTFTYVVTVQPPVSVTSANYMGACSGIPINYTITANVPAATVTYSWLRISFPGISNPPVSNQTSSVINEALINTTNSVVYVPYFITPYSNGCQGEQYVFVAGVYPVPSTPAASSNSPVCNGEAIILQAQPVTGATYQWTGPNGFVSTQQNPQIPNATAANAGTYQLTVITNNCPSTPLSIDVQVGPPPVVTVGPDQTVCVTQNVVTVTGDVSGSATTGYWTSNGTGQFLTPTGQIKNVQYMPSAQDKSNGSVTLTLRSSSKFDCNPSVSTVITFAPTPAVDAGPDQEACAQSGGILLNGKLLKPGSGTWTTSGTGTFTPSANLTNARYVPSKADALKGSVTLTFHYNNASVCDIASDDVVIKLIPPPTVNAGGIRYVLKDHTITLEPTVSDPNVQYLWTPNIGLSSNTVKNPVLTGTKDRVYTLTVTDSRGCSSQDSTHIKVSPVITVNNTFTPNADGVNDQWNITGLSAYVDADVNIYNRLGKLLYHSVGYGKPWDGTYNGQLLPVGTYYYVIKLNVNGQVLSGDITIVR